MTAPSVAPQADHQRVVFLFDVDNTLLDNDQIVSDLRSHLEQEFGLEQSEGYWRLFEARRQEIGYADYLGALQQYRLEYPHHPRILKMSTFLIDYLISCIHAVARMKLQRTPDAASSNSRSNSSLKPTNHVNSTRRSANTRSRQSGKTPIIKAVLEIAVSMNAKNANIKKRITPCVVRFLTPKMHLTGGVADQTDPSQT